MLIAMGFLEFAVIMAVVATAHIIIPFFWNLVEWIQKYVYPELSKIFGAALKGCKAFLTKAAPVAGKVVQKLESYIYKSGTWIKRTVTKVVSKEEVPENIRTRLASAEETDDVDITKELELELA